MTQTEIDKFTSGYNEGFMYAVQLMAGEAIRTIHNQPRILGVDKTIVTAKIKQKAATILNKRGLMPYSYDVLTGKAEKVELDFNLKA